MISVMGASETNRAVRLRSVAISPGRAGLVPSPISTIPGRPMARWTRSWLLFAATAGVMPQPSLAMFCTTATAAPGWPSIDL